MHQTNRPNRQKSGFTLVEIMIVVAVIGVLATIAMPALAKARHQSQVTATASELRVFDEAFNMFEMDHATYPKPHLAVPMAIFQVGVLPPPMEDYLRAGHWNRGPKIGGDYYYSGSAMQYFGGAGKLGERYFMQIVNSREDPLFDVAEIVDPASKGVSAYGQCLVGFGDRMYYFFDPVTW
jgi:prepilin-type N-terminal cleavage/methylation domain-containing protein